eukprot:2013977-Rhodomonas_salina.1
MPRLGNGYVAQTQCEKALAATLHAREKALVATGARGTHDSCSEAEELDSLIFFLAAGAARVLEGAAGRLTS